MRTVAALSVLLLCSTSYAADDAMPRFGGDAGRPAEKFRLTQTVGIKDPPDFGITTTIYLDIPFRDEYTDPKGNTIIVYGLLRQVGGKYLLDLTVGEKYGKKAGRRLHTSGEYKLGEPDSFCCFCGIGIFYTTLLTR